MKQEEQPMYFRMALGLQGICVSEELADQVLQTWERIQKKGGKFDIHDAVDIKLGNERKWEEKRLLEKKKKKKEKKKA